MQRETVNDRAHQNRSLSDLPVLIHEVDVGVHHMILEVPVNDVSEREIDKGVAHQAYHAKAKSAVNANHLLNPVHQLCPAPRSVPTPES